MADVLTSGGLELKLADDGTVRAADGRDVAQMSERRRVHIFGPRRGALVLGFRR